MFLWNLEVYRRYSQMARGLEKAELVFKNGRVFSSGTGEFIEGDVAVADGIVIGVGTYEGETEIDLDGKVICPGFIDSHLHLESTLGDAGRAGAAGGAVWNYDVYCGSRMSQPTCRVRTGLIIFWIRRRMLRRMCM